MTISPRALLCEGKVGAIEPPPLLPAQLSKRGGFPIPVTPFHFGPGLLVKVMLPRCFSWVAFAAANVLVDIEVLFHFVCRDPSLHRHCHSLPIATGLGVVAGGLTFFASRRYSETVPARWRSSPLWIPSDTPRLFWVCLVSGIVGGVSHVILDSIIHADILPFWPLSNAGWLYRVLTRPTVNLGCLAAGLLGAALWLVLEFRRPSPDQDNSSSEPVPQDLTGGEKQEE